MSNTNIEQCNLLKDRQCWAEGAIFPPKYPYAPVDKTDNVYTPLVIYLDQTHKTLHERTMGIGSFLAAFLLIWTDQANANANIIGLQLSILFQNDVYTYHAFWFIVIRYTTIL